ncbi:MAG: hypothetical protein LUQ41_06645, partial [Methanomicrobiales archaeon]|nr:hypothetical protein [Methanomicrobiales archaeon]
GIFDIYMPDAKYGSDDVALRLSDAPGYVGVNQAALREMHRQAGDLVIRDGIAVRGLIIRHLVLPHGLAGTDMVMGFIADGLSRDTYVNVMPQYRPCGRISTMPVSPSSGSSSSPSGYRSTGRPSRSPGGTGCTGDSGDIFGKMVSGFTHTPIIYAEMHPTEPIG